jgi:hypothetical protein
VIGGSPEVEAGGIQSGSPTACSDMIARSNTGKEVGEQDRGVGEPRSSTERATFPLNADCCLWNIYGGGMMWVQRWTAV